MEVGVSKVLLVEDEMPMQKLWRAQVEDLFKGEEMLPELLFAATIVEALTLFRTNLGIDVIVVDGHLKTAAGKVDTLPVIREFKKAGFMGPMIATSSDPKLRALMMEAGCNRECERKDYAMRMVKTLLEFDPQATSVTQALGALIP